jgi:hypothetical protein
MPRWYWHNAGGLLMTKVPNCKIPRARTTNRPTVVHGLDMRTNTGRRYRDIMAGLTAALGGELTEPQRFAVQRAAGILVAAEEMRAKAMRGDKIPVTGLVKLENLATRALALLDLPKPGSKRGPTLEEYWARKRSELA